MHICIGQNDEAVLLYITQSNRGKNNKLENSEKSKDFLLFNFIRHICLSYPLCHRDVVKQDLLKATKWDGSIQRVIFRHLCLRASFECQ